MSESYSSLSEVLEIVSTAQLKDELTASRNFDDLALWIAGRQGKKGTYRGLPAPTELDYAGPVRLFTGEKLTTQAGKGHILGEEACQALIAIDSSNKLVTNALASATGSFTSVLDDYEREEWKPFGMFCCATCSVAFWRHLAAGGLDRQEERLNAGVNLLKSRRDNKGSWRSFPFWYTISALERINLPIARQEIEYTGKRLERAAKRSRNKDNYSERRGILAEKALSLL